MDNITETVESDAPDVTEEAQETSTETTESGITNWKDSLPEDLRNSPNITKFADPAALAKSYQHLSELNGKSVRIPDENTPPEDRAAFLDKLGRPENAQSYKVDPGEGVEVDSERVASFLPIAYEAGLTQTQVDAVSKFEGDWHRSKIEAVKKDISEGTEAMKSEWGHDFEGNLKETEDFMNRMLDEKAVTLATQTGLRGNPSFVKMLHAFSKTMKEGEATIKEGDSVTSPAEEEIKQIMSDKDGAYQDGNHPRHKEAVARVRALSVQIHGTENAFSENTVITSEGRTS